MDGNGPVSPSGHSARRGSSGGAPPDLEAIVTGLLDKHMDSLERNIPLKIAMDLASDPAKQNTIMSMDWWLRRFDGNCSLLSDRPLLASSRMPYPCGIPSNDPSCLIVLPISPGAIFFMSAHPNTRAKMRSMPRGRILRIINEETIWRSVEYVYAADRSMSGFLRDRLCAKADGTWRATGNTLGT